MSAESESGSVYPIRVVAQRTGVNPVTLRAWERRYGLVAPQRTAKGHRLYSAGDIAVIDQILALLDQGVAISRVRDLLAPATSPPPGGAGETWIRYLQRMLTAVGDFDEPALEATYSDALSLYPVDMVTHRLLEPLLAELARRWHHLPHADAERGFFHSYLRNKLGARFHQQNQQARGSRLIVAGLPGGATETGLLLLALALLGAGLGVVLLGAGRSPDALPHALARTGASALVLHAPLVLPSDLLEGTLSRLVQESPTPVFVAGAAVQAQAEALRRAGLVALPRDTASAAEELRVALAADTAPGPGGAR